MLPIPGPGFWPAWGRKANVNGPKPGPFKLALRPQPAKNRLQSQTRGPEESNRRRRSGQRKRSPLPGRSVGPCKQCGICLVNRTLSIWWDLGGHGGPRDHAKLWEGLPPPSSPQFDWFPEPPGAAQTSLIDDLWLAKKHILKNQANGSVVQADR